MQVLVSKPLLEQFIESQIKEGRFVTATDVVEAALARFMEGDADAEIDDETCDRLLLANERIDKGEGRSFDTVAEDLRPTTIA